ncbi:FHA domain-containing protein [Sorangium sp. So ce1078]|uniref:FHA domain-containing protein n=1 Tax=Sorangium sp. So ce1078 TaxID=3133329 RepID=UPI003F647962
MGTLKDPATGRLMTLGARCLFGRHPACDVRIDEPRVSGEHASLHWMGNRWELRDLGSRNGTFVQGRRLSPGERVSLPCDVSFSLAGQGAAFVLTDADPPGAAARSEATGARRAASGGILVLPDEDRPLASVFEDNAGRWVLEMGDEVRPVEDHEVIHVGGEAFALELPRCEVETWQSEGGSLVLESAHLRLAVSADEERVRTTVVLRGQETTLPLRTHHYLLVTLARAWLSGGGKVEAQRGWVDRDVLCRMLGTDVNKLNVDIHRARKQFAALGIQNAAGIVERRPGTGELRIGVKSVEVTRM